MCTFKDKTFRVPQKKKKEKDTLFYSNATENFEKLL